MSTRRRRGDRLGETLLLLGGVALVAAKFVREVGSRSKGSEIGGYL